jgi:hypothetical protein
MHVDKLNIQLRQETKWGELDVFFKTNSQYYKQIDNDEVVFIVGLDGPDFIANLFLNDLNETITNNRIQSELIWNHIKYNRQGPEPWFDDHIIWDSPGHTDPKQHTTLLPESFELLKTLNTPETLSYSIDTNLKNFFSNDKTLNGTRYFITQLLPVVAYFYYKNFEKVKIILIEINDVFIETYTYFLWTLRVSHGIGNSAMLSSRPGRTTQEAWIEEQGLYSVLDRFKEIKKIIGDNEFTNGIIIEALANNQWTFINDIEEKYHCLKKYETIKPLYIDILHTLSSKNNAGIMDFPIFTDQLYKFNYRTLFFEKSMDEKFKSSSIKQNKNDIKHLIKLFNATHDVDYYTKEIYKYNVANIELKNQLEHELFLALDKLKKNNK